MASAPDLANRILAGDLRALARAATLIENGSSAARDLLAALFPHTGRALTIGLTGPPGAGKSTLASAVTAIARREGKRVAILAVDPSSPFTQGAILGDRIRMQQHYDDPDVFVRSMATRGHLGGLAAATFDMALLLDAAGFDLVFIETVGVGQGEVEIASLADVTVVVLVPGLGDDVQTLKAGVLEIADVFAINKADLPGAEQLENEIRAMQTLVKAGVIAPVQRVVAMDGAGVDDLLHTILTGPRNSKREAFWTERLRRLVHERLDSRLGRDRFEAMAAEVAQRRTDPFTAADGLIDEVLK